MKLAFKNVCNDIDNLVTIYQVCTLYMRNGPKNINGNIGREIVGYGLSYTFDRMHN